MTPRPMFLRRAAERAEALAAQVERQQLRAARRAHAGVALLLALLVGVPAGLILFLATVAR